MPTMLLSISVTDSNVLANSTGAVCSLYAEQVIILTRFFLQMYAFFQIGRANISLN